MTELVNNSRLTEAPDIEDIKINFDNFISKEENKDILKKIANTISDKYVSILQNKNNKSKIRRIAREIVTNLPKKVKEFFQNNIKLLNSTIFELIWSENDNEKNFFHYVLKNI